MPGLRGATPRGELPAEGVWTDFCCGDCRKRHTSPSVRFCGRRVYLEIVFVLACLTPATVEAVADPVVATLDEEPTPPAASAAAAPGPSTASAAPSSPPSIASAFGVPGRTLTRWRKWWREEFPASRVWRELQARLLPPVESASLDATTGRELARLPRGNQREVAAVVQRRGLSTRQTQTLVEAWIAAPTDDVRASLLSTVRGTRQTEEGPPARRPRSPAEWLHCEAEELRRRCGRLQGRLVGGPQPDPETIEDLRGLVPALSGLLNTLSKTLPKRHAA